MQSKATTVEKYLAELPADRRAAIAALRSVIRANLDSGFEEGMQYGMIGYYVPHRLFPAGYHCDPKQPLPFAGLASQKNHMAFYVMGLYTGLSPDGKDNGHRPWFEDAWKRSGKKLDMGAACVRFKKIEDLPLDVVAQAFKRFTAAGFIELYLRALDSRAKPGTAAKEAERNNLSVSPALAVRGCVAPPRKPSKLPASARLAPNDDCSAKRTACFVPPPRKAAPKAPAKKTATRKSVKK